MPFIAVRLHRIQTRYSVIHGAGSIHGRCSFLLLPSGRRLNAVSDMARISGLSEWLAIFLGRICLLRLAVHSPPQQSISASERPWRRKVDFQRIGDEKVEEETQTNEQDPITACDRGRFDSQWQPVPHQLSHYC